jgi:hypothetical protein
MGGFKHPRIRGAVFFLLFGDGKTDLPGFGAVLERVKKDGLCAES